MRSIANTTLSLGLLNAPIKLYKATEDPDFKFSMCGPKGEDLEQVYRVRGGSDIYTHGECGRKFENFQIDTDTLTTIEDESTKEEVDGVMVNMKETVTIRKFMPVKDIPFERSTGRYYVGPGKGSDQAFATILKAMERKRLAATVKFCIRGRQGVYALFVKDGVMNAVKLTFASDIRETPDTLRPETEPTKAHVDMAITLMDNYMGDVSDLDEIKDTLIDKKRELAEAARSGEAIEVTDVPDSVTDAPDMMDVLTASIEKVKVAS